MINIINSILIKFKGLYATFIDYLTTLFSSKSNIDIMQSVGIRNTYKDEKLSKKITDLFVDTKVNIYVFESKYTYAFTMSGIVKLSAPLTFRILLICRHIPIIGSFINKFYAILLYIERLTTLSKAEYGDGSGIVAKKINKNSKLIIDPKTKKAELSIKEVTCFTSSAFVDLLNEEEVIALLLHEVGHNTMILQNIISGVLKNSSMFFLLFLLIKNYSKPTNNDPLNSFRSMSIGIITFLLIINIIVLYMDRRHEVLADEFAIKMGYGEYLYSGYEKWKKFSLFDIFGNTFRKIKDSNIFDKILHFLETIGQWLAIPFQKLGLEAHPDFFTRNKMIKEKTEKFNKEMKNKLDRSDNIYGNNFYDKLMDREPDKIKSIKEDLERIINNVTILNS